MAIVILLLTATIVIYGSWTQMQNECPNCKVLNATEPIMKVNQTVPIGFIELKNV